jgi:hypothetical protein
MTQTDSRTISRRTTLKTAGALSLFSTLGVGSALAKPDRNRNRNNFGNGNGAGAFLNERALYTASPVWGDCVVDMTGQDTVEVVVGAMTSVELPEAPPMLPLTFAPVAVEVSPDTTVVWT